MTTITQNEQNLILQKTYILGTGSIANANQLAEFNEMLDQDDGVDMIDSLVNSHVNSLIAQQGVVATFQAIAKNGYGITLSSNEAEAAISDLLSAGIDSGAKLINYLNTAQWDHSNVLDNRAEAASGFLETLDAAGKSEYFAGSAVTHAAYTLLQNIDGSTVSLSNGSDGFDALSDNLSATGITGTLDTYLSGATVFADANRDGELNEGEWTTTTDATGTFEVLGDTVAGKIVVSGGESLMTGNDFHGVLSSSTGSTVVNPITTVIEAMVASGLCNTVNEATSAIKSALDLPADINLLSYNPLAVLSSSTASSAEKAVALQVQTASQQIGNIITHTASVIDIATTGATLNSAAAAATIAIGAAITAAADSSGTIDLADNASIGSIIEATVDSTGSSVTTAQIDQIAQVTAGSNASAAAATNITMLAQAANVAQGSATDALIAGATSGDFSNAVDDFTGSSLTSANYDVTVGDLAPGVPTAPTAKERAAADNASDAAADAAALVAPTAVLTFSTDGGTSSTTTASVNDSDTLRIIATFDKTITDNTPTIAIDNTVLAVTAMTKIDATHYYYDLDVPSGDVAAATITIGGARSDASNVISAAPTNATFAVDNTAASAPVGVILTPVGGTVVTNTLQASNTNLTATAAITAGEATGGTAQLMIGATIIATDEEILGGDTSVNFNLGTVDNAGLQAAIAAGGVATVTVTDAAGNSSVSAVANPTLAVDYAADLVDMTTALDDIEGSANNDVFSGTDGDGAGPYTFNVGDIFDGLGGSDTLNITTGAEANSPSDTLFAEVSNFESVKFNSIGNGAQSITTGTNFEAAFATQGVDVTVQTLLGAIDLTMTTFTGAADITTITTGSGAHSIVTGSGLTTVNATGVSAGAQTINGVGLSTVTATINGAGDQVIGTTSGGNIVNVEATILAAGSQTIASTSSSDVVIVASAAAGSQTVTTADGNDDITTSGAAGEAATISSNNGDDVIVSGLTTDLITGGTGADAMTGGGGVDTFAFGADGSVIGADMDSIADFNSADADILQFAGDSTLLTLDATALVAGVNVNTTAGGVITFHADDNALASKIVALQADAQLDSANSVAMFIDGGNTYVYHAGSAIGNLDDQLIQLTGIETLTTMTGGATLVIA